MPTFCAVDPTRNWQEPQRALYMNDETLVCSLNNKTYIACNGNGMTPDGSLFPGAEISVVDSASPSKDL